MILFDKNQLLELINLKIGLIIFKIQNFQLLNYVSIKVINVRVCLDEWNPKKIKDGILILVFVPLM